MPDLFLSVNSKILKATFITQKGEFKSITKPITEGIVTDSYINKVDEFTSFVQTLLKDFLHGEKGPFKLNFVIEPENIYSEFIELSRSSQEDFDEVIEKAKHQLEGVSLNELYYVHNRLAPFIRHFVGIKKVVLDNYIQIAQNLKMELKSVIPWNFLLPKYTNALEPSIFVFINDNETTLALSEYNNVYFSKTYSKRFKPEDLETYIHDLSNYDKTAKINKVYLFGKDTLKLREPYELIKVSLPKSSLEETQGYENHVLTQYMVDTDSNVLLNYTNALTLLPLPTTVKSPSSLAYVGASLSVFILLAGVIYGGYKLNTSISSSKDLSLNKVSTQKPDVAGAEVKKADTAPSNVGTGSTEPKKEEKKLEKKDLNIMIENGAGIAGLASKTKNLLEKLGYKIYDIGDATLTDRQNTVIKFKKDKLDYKELLQTDIKEKFLDVVVQDDLDPKEKYDVLIIVGSKVDDL